MAIGQLGNIVVNRVNLQAVTRCCQPLVKLVNRKLVDSLAGQINLPHHPTGARGSAEQYHQQVAVGQQLYRLRRAKSGVEIVIPDQLARGIRRHNSQ